MTDPSTERTATVAVVYHSATGRTRAVAEALARGAEEIPGTTTHLCSIDDDALKADRLARLHAILAAADAIVFGCPTYMGSASGAFKMFMDSTSAVWALQGWRDKLAAGFTHSAAPSGDKLGTLIELAVFAAQHGMVWIGLGLPPTYAGAETPAEDTNRLGSHLGAMAQSRPGGGAVPEGDLRTAAILGRRVAEAALRWNARRPSKSAEPPSTCHEAARGWALPPASRSAPPAGIERVNVREIAARPERFEHHLVVCATVDDVQLEIATASEPLYFAHINISDEYAIALPTGDDLVDRFPLRTFLSDPNSGVDVGRYNHRIGDLILHPKGYLHWPGRLRPPYQPFDFPPGMRRAGLVLVYCASRPTPPAWCPLPIPADRSEDVKAYVDPAPPMVLASLRSPPAPLATIGRTTLALVELPDAIAPVHGGFALVLEALPESGHHVCDLYRIPEGSSLEGKGIVRALVLSSDGRAPDPAPPSWKRLPEPPLSPLEDGERGALPIDAASLRIEEKDERLVTVLGGSMSAEVPRYWLARMLFRVGLHQLRLGYVETYGGFFVDDRDDGVVVLGLHRGVERTSVTVPRAEALALIERIYRAVAPPGYVERPA